MLVWVTLKARKIKDGHRNPYRTIGLVIDDQLTIPFLLTLAASVMMAYHKHSLHDGLNEKVTRPRKGRDQTTKT
jgi:hypothetical protein